MSRALAFTLALLIASPAFSATFGGATFTGGSAFRAAVVDTAGQYVIEAASNSNDNYCNSSEVDCADPFLLVADDAADGVGTPSCGYSDGNAACVATGPLFWRANPANDGIRGSGFKLDWPDPDNGFAEVQDFVYTSPDGVIQPGPAGARSWFRSPVIDNANGCGCTSGDPNYDGGYGCVTPSGSSLGAAGLDGLFYFPRAVTEFSARFYFKFDDDVLNSETFCLNNSNQKHVRVYVHNTATPSDDDTGRPSSNIKFQPNILYLETGNITGGFADVWRGGALNMTKGNWYLVEGHWKMNSTGFPTYDSEFKMWVDDCGADGLSCPVTQTLRIDTVNDGDAPGTTTGAELGGSQGYNWFTRFNFNNWSNGGGEGVKGDALLVVCEGINGMIGRSEWASHGVKTTCPGT